MKIAFTVWGKRISPVFDSADTLQIVEINDKKIEREIYTDFNPRINCDFLEDLAKLGVNVLVCGAISQSHSSLIEASPIILVPFICGKTKDIIETFVKGDPLSPVFLMPGCSERISSY